MKMLCNAALAALLVTSAACDDDSDPSDLVDQFLAEQAAACEAARLAESSCTVELGTEAIDIGAGTTCIRQGYTTFGQVIDRLPQGVQHAEGTFFTLRISDLGISLHPYDEDESLPLRDRVVKTIFLSAPYSGRTPSGVGIGMSRGDVYARLGSPEKAAGTNIDDFGDVWITFDDADRVERFHLMLANRFSFDKPNCPL